MNIVFKPSEPADAEQIILAKADAFKEEVKLYGRGPTDKSPVEKEREFIENAQGNNFSYILLENGKKIGGVGVVDKGSGEFYLKHIYVALDYQNKGIGSRIMNFLDNQFPEAAIWTLETPYLSYRNHHFYEKHGFVKVGETEPGEDGFYLFLYRKIKKQ
ncbi:MAG: GNAT family N-acetyltransferase [Bacillota bacterium]|nr:GNAT family N-acetyltransferase [Bacillota bacterium]